MVTVALLALPPGLDNAHFSLNTTQQFHISRLRCPGAPNHGRIAKKTANNFNANNFNTVGAGTAVTLLANHARKNFRRILRENPGFNHN